MAATKQERETALEYLQETIRPGDTVWTILRHVTRSGMGRSISVIVDTSDGPADVSWAVARVTGLSFDRDRGGVKVSGCGMDMGFHLVYSLARTLFRDSFECVGEDCPSNDHSNGDRDYSPHQHSDGGYALRQRWL